MCVTARLHGTSHERTLPHAVAADKTTCSVLGKYMCLKDGFENSAEQSDAHIRFRLVI